MFKLDLKNILRHSNFGLFPQTDSYQCGKKKKYISISRFNCNNSFEQKCCSFVH